MAQRLTPPSPHNDSSQMAVTSPAKPEYYQKVLSDMEFSRSLAIFRRYDDINLLNLMSLQAEISTLKDALEFRRQHDSQDPQLAIYDRSFEALRDSHPRRKTDETRTSNCCHSCCHRDRWCEGDILNMSRYELMERLRVKMSDYNALIIQVSQLSKVSPPPKSQLELLKDVVRYEARKLQANSTGDDIFPPAAEYSVWQEDDPDKYYSLNKEDVENDSFTRVMKERIIPVFHWALGRRIFKKRFDPEAQLTAYKDDTLVKASSFIAVMVSSALPVVTVFVLNRVETTDARIAWTVGFTMVFAGVLVLFSSAKRAEIFAATATFAAVEVVFIGSSLKSS